MTTHSDESARGPRVSRAGFELGARLALPVLPGMIAFGLAVGATAARKGLSFLDNLLMNLFV
jgi:predicted branched-subunit amino acid permease